MLTAGAIMTSDLVTVRPDVSVQEAIDVLLINKSAACRCRGRRSAGRGDHRVCLAGGCVRQAR